MSSYTRLVGERLRRVRQQQRLSLQAVEAASGEEFRASVLGAYERGERVISVPRLQRLADFYHVPVDQLLPQDPGHEPGPGAADPAADSAGDGLTIDLTRVEQLGPESLGEAGAEMLGRYLSTIQLQRQDFNGRVLTVRRDDLRALAAFLDVSVEEVRRRLDAPGLRRPSAAGGRLVASRSDPRG
ncbi:MAG: transcriptional regulator [Actinomycetota bacterium]|nr:transcriptional regulator [Actinomycetota bacterium]